VSEETIRIRLLIADEGAFHEMDLTVPASVAEDYDRLIDGLREDPAVLKKIHLDLARLAAVWVVEGGE
jgi:hypothetical protein